jgi:hypothetical protein
MLRNNERITRRPGLVWEHPDTADGWLFMTKG